LAKGSWNHPCRKVHARAKMLRSSRAAVLRTKRPEIETRQNDQFVASWTREFLRRGTAAYNDIGDREVEVQMAGRPAAARVRWSRTAVVVARTAGSDRKMRPVEGPPGDERERESGVVTGRVVSTRPPTAAVPLRPAGCSLSSVTASNRSTVPCPSLRRAPSTTSAATSARSRHRG
jgi:hypothetical protein